eukprot:5259494-Alexandrium_andersonii.AAC.1
MAASAAGQEVSLARAGALMAAHVGKQQACSTCAGASPSGCGSTYPKPSPHSGAPAQSAPTSRRRPGGSPGRA